MNAGTSATETYDVSALPASASGMAVTEADMNTAKDVPIRRSNHLDGLAERLRTT